MISKYGALGRFGYRCETGKSGVVMDGQLSQHPAVDAYTGFAKARDQLVVGRAAQACCGIDAHNPKPAEFTLAVTAVAIRIPHGVHAGLVGSPVQQMLAAFLPFSIVQYLLVPLMGRHAPLDSRQPNNSLPATRSAALFQIWRRALNVKLLASGRDFNPATIETLGPLGSIASQMALMPFRPHDFARTRQAKPLGGGLMSLDLWH
jgi:hypothetical protein